MIEGALCARYNDGPRTKIKKRQRQRGLFHGIGAVGDENALNLVTSKLGLHASEEFIQIRQGDRA